MLTKDSGNWFGGQAISLAVDYTHSKEFRAAGYEAMMVDGTEYGEVRQYGNFSFARIYESGHEVPYYQRKSNPPTPFLHFPTRATIPSLSASPRKRTLTDLFNSRRGPRLLQPHTEPLRHCYRRRQTHSQPNDLGPGKRHTHEFVCAAHAHVGVID